MASISAYVNNNTDQYSLVMLAERQTEYDTFIIFENFIWNKAFKWKVLGIYKQNGFDYMYYYKIPTRSFLLKYIIL